MFLQVYFFIVTIFGWYKWKSNTADVPVTSAGPLIIKIIAVIMLIGTIGVGLVIRTIHTWLPALDHYHRATLKRFNIKYEEIAGNWDERFKQSVALIIELINR